MNWETVDLLATILVPILTVSVGWVIKGLIDLSKAVSSLKTWKEEHDKADQREHDRLGSDNRESIEELRLFRAESTEQHNNLGAKLDRLAEEGRRDRKGIHERIDSMSKDVQRLVGRAEIEDRTKT